MAFPLTMRQSSDIINYQYKSKFVKMVLNEVRVYENTDL